MRDAEGEALAERIRAFVRDSLAEAPAEAFDTLAADIAAYQRRRDPVAAALPGPIPPVPVALFKQLAVGTVPADADTPAFRTSGTTRGGRGVHRMWSTDLLDLGSLAWARHCLGTVPGEIVGLLLDPIDHPDSSLSHMVATFRRIAGPGRTTWHLPGGRVDREGLATRLATASGPVFLAATAFALADWLGQRVPPLPDGSLVMVTGGFKGRTTALDHTTLFARAADTLGARVVTEYGMTELSSQLWGTPDTPYRPPPWLAVEAVDPVTGETLPADHAGQLRFTDLCNLDGAVCVETLDHGVVHPDGTVTLLGRLPGAAVRGCSLTVEDAWATR